ncbi:MAG: cyclic nucleotide-binding domain-containing protein [Acidobacteria bacterium]|nr:cyclic nucleotide-binding domain-containing protein [Acidobacteriota bacterium]
MQGIAGLLGETPVFSKFDKWSLQYMAGLAERKEYKAGEWLFREFAPREWFGVIERGDVRIVRGPDDHHTLLAVLGRGGILSESILLSNRNHSTGAYTREGAVVARFFREAMEKARKERPDLHYRILACIAQAAAERLRYAADCLTPEDQEVAFGQPQSTWSIVNQ